MGLKNLNRRGNYLRKRVNNGQINNRRACPTCGKDVSVRIGGGLWFHGRYGAGMNWVPCEGSGSKWNS